MIIIINSDGIIDQFGGPDSKKFLTRNFKELLLDVHTDEVRKQKQRIEDRLDRWMGDNDQVDDILVIGIRV